MPAPQLERRDNPLRKLRIILGNGPKPMHQDDFAHLIDIPVATIRAIEAGRRELTWENCLGRIAYLLGATFDERDRQWHYMRARDHLYTFSLYKAFTDKRSKDPVLKAKCLHALVQRTLELFKAVPPGRWFAFFGCVMAKLKEAAIEFKIKGYSGIVDRTEPRWGLVTLVQDADGNRYPPDALPEIVTYFDCFESKSDSALKARDSGGLLDFRQWREFNPAESTPEQAIE
jgi:DNA-binding XRE family transcriptional regulator